MKFQISNTEQIELREKLTSIVSEYLSKESKGLFITTTNAKEKINENILEILEALLKVSK